MSGAPPGPWADDWFESARPTALQAWRGVQAQHVVSTMRLVDTLDEQAVLEQLLERSKPALPTAAAGKHFLLTTPFRYRPRHASRFRPVGAPGVWYGAQERRTACAEIAYWRWRFLMDSAGLQGVELLSEHTLFQASIQGLTVDLMQDPWSAQRALWTDPLDYRHTHALAQAARTRRMQCIAYESARDAGGVCAAVLDMQALESVDLASRQTWHCKTQRQGVRLVHGADRHEWWF